MRNNIELYELTSADDTSACPFVWRIKFALALKQLPYTVKRIGFLEIPRILGGRHKSVPVMVDEGHELGDSWLIADHLDTAYPDAPSLFKCVAERATIRFIDGWLNTQILPKLLTIYVLDIHDRARPEDRAYFRETREARLGRRLEDVHAGREALLPALRATFQPLRQTIGNQPYLSGDAPGYGDFMAMGVIMWGGGVGSIGMFEAGDPLLAWVERCLDLYGGVGREIALPGLIETSAQ